MICVINTNHISISGDDSYNNDSYNQDEFEYCYTLEKDQLR